MLKSWRKENVSKVYIVGDVNNGTVTQGEDNNVSSVIITSSPSNSNMDATIQDALDVVVEEMRRTAKTATQFITIAEAVQAKEEMKNNNKNKAIEHMKNCGKWLLDVSKQTGAQVLVDLLTGS